MIGGFVLGQDLLLCANLRQGLLDFFAFGLIGSFEFLLLKYLHLLVAATHLTTDSTANWLS